MKTLKHDSVCGEGIGGAMQMATGAGGGKQRPPNEQKATTPPKKK